MMLRKRRLKLPGIGLPGSRAVVGADFLTDVTASDPVAHLRL